MCYLLVLAIAFLLYASICLLTGRSYTPKTWGWINGDGTPGMAQWLFCGTTMVMAIVMAIFFRDATWLRNIIDTIFSPTGMAIIAMAFAGFLAWQGTVGVMRGTVSFYWLSRRRKVSRSDNATFFSLAVFYYYLGAFIFFAAGIYVAQLTPEELRSSSFRKHAVALLSS
ncbi:MAG: hypothetical protein IT291_06465 [Deltaproteobacteria bacterium]|nr:hypothetical protein [Deltaproteobacteria bacterium]